MRGRGFQYTPIGINLAMLEAANTATMPLGHSVPSWPCHMHTHTHMFTNKLLCVFVAPKRFCFFVLWDAYINRLSFVQSEAK